MVGRRKARDQVLLDQVDRLTRIPLSQRVWRAVRAGRDPLETTSISGRWNIDTFEVLYAAFDPDGAVAEVNYHVNMQPVFPSRFRVSLHELNVTLVATARFETLDELVPFGVDPARYKEPLYERSQEIGDAAAFLGFDGLVAPSARWDCLNLVMFVDHITPDRFQQVGETVINLDEWREAHKLDLRRQASWKASCKGRPRDR